MPMKKNRISMILQIALLFIVGVILTGAISSIIIYVNAFDFVESSLLSSSEATKEDLHTYIENFNAHDWLLQYWYDHYDEMDIEYDVEYNAGTKTSEKCRLLIGRHPHLEPHYATIQEIEDLPPEDQKLYAEIAYSWLITRIDHLVEIYNYDYLYAIITSKPYDQSFLLFIAGKDNPGRGDGPGLLYPLGKVLTQTSSQKEAIISAINGKPKYSLNEDSRYLDFYFSLDTIKNGEVLLGMSHNLNEIEHDIWGHAISHSILSMIFLIILAILCLLMILLIVLQPLKKIQQNIRNYKLTKDSKAVVMSLSEIHSHNELADLSDDVAELTKEMDDYTVRIRKITSDNERIETELDLASRIQTSMLPNVFPAFPDRKDFDIFASMDPAKEVGGDFYDFFLLDDNHLCLIIADVSGKGVPAALYTMATKIILSQNIRMGKSPAEALSDTNETICHRNPEKMFVTVWLGMLDLSTGILTASNAGHEYPVILNNRNHFELFKDTHGFVIGGMDGLKYKEYDIQMKPGAKLFLYTDGLTEAVNDQKEMFGTDRILEVLNQSKNLSSQQIVENMKAAVNVFIQNTEPFDDLTMMCVCYNGSDTQES